MAQNRTKQILRGPPDKMGYVDSWVSDTLPTVDINTVESSTSRQNDSTFSVPPQLCDESGNLSGHGLIAQTSQARIGKMQSMLREDMSGHPLETSISKGRYIASSHKDDAFCQIGFSDLSISKDILDNTVSLGLSGHQLGSLPKTVFTKSAYARSSFIRAKQQAGQQQSRDTIDDEDSQDESVTSDTRGDPSEKLGDLDDKAGPSTAHDDEEVAKDEISPLGNKKAKTGNMGCSFRGMLGIGKWRVKSKKHGIKGMRAFAKDEAHHSYIVDNMEKVAVELPLPFQKLILEEAYKVIRPTAKDYIKVLGRKDPLTKCALERMDEISHTLRMCESL